MADEDLGRLALVRDFVNTLDMEEQRETVGTSEELVRWLTDRGLMAPSATPPPTPADHALALATRETIRRLLLANNGEEQHPEDLAALDRLAAKTSLVPRFSYEGVRLEPQAGGVTGALGRLLAIMVEAMAEGRWERLKACSSHTCQWAFYDRSKNHSGHWCSMKVCGNRAKARQFREKRRTE